MPLRVSVKPFQYSSIRFGWYDIRAKVSVFYSCPVGYGVEHLIDTIGLDGVE